MDKIACLSGWLAHAKCSEAFYFGHPRVGQGPVMLKQMQNEAVFFQFSFLFMLISSLPLFKRWLHIF